MTTIETGLTDYLARLRGALGDLPDDELTDLMDDIEPHVIEVFAESGDPIARLGEPEDYAAELRAAGGYPPAPRKRSSARGRFVFWVVGLTAMSMLFAGMIATRQPDSRPLPVLLVWLPLFIPAVWMVLGGRVARADITGLGEYRFGERVLAVVTKPDYLRALRPAARLARGLVLVLACLAVFHDEPSVGLVMVALAVVLSLPTTSPRSLVLTVPGNAFVVGVALMLALGVAFPRTESGGGSTGLTYQGRYLTNLFAVDSAGKPITDFSLYDDTGAPITIGHASCEPRAGNQRHTFPLPRISYENDRCVETPASPGQLLPPR